MALLVREAQEGKEGRTVPLLEVSVRSEQGLWAGGVCVSPLPVT